MTQPRPTLFSTGLMDNISRYLDPVGVDYSVCEGQHLEVHKVIVCAQSAVLHAAFTRPFKASDCPYTLQWAKQSDHTQEARSGAYEMEGDSLPMIKKMISYFYTADYNEEVARAGEESCDTVMSVLQVHARMFAIADKYDVKGLRTLSAAKYSSRLRRGSTAVEFLESVPDVYTLTATVVRSLRDEATHFARANLKRFLRDQSFRQAYEELAFEVPDFFIDLLDSYVKCPVIGRCYNCGPHQSMEVLEARCLQCKKGTHNGFR